MKFGQEQEVWVHICTWQNVQAELPEPTFQTYSALHLWLMFLIWNTCFNHRGFPNQLMKSLLFWGTCLRFGSQPLPSSSTMFTIDGNSISNSAQRSCKYWLSCSATKIWRVDFGFSLTGCEVPYLCHNHLKW